jgi:hypothetical protein
MDAKKPLSRFEALAQQLVEGTFRRLLGQDTRSTDVIAAQLAQAVAASRRDSQLATRYEIALSPEGYLALQPQQQVLMTELVAYVESLATELEATLPQRPFVMFKPNPVLHKEQVTVEAYHESQKANTTQIQERPLMELDIAEALRQLDAYLIVGGRQHVPLDKALVTIGRQLDNDVVLDLATVSRRHAQIRWRFGRFVLYDLSRKGRTAVNGQPISEHALQPGDVIALSHMMLIYGEGNTRANTAVGSSSLNDDTQIIPGQTP